jgi:hypothetical protein
MSEKFATKTFTYILASDIPLEIEVQFLNDDIYDITAAQEGGMDIFEELRKVFIREFASTNFKTVADDILDQAEQLGSIH